MGGKKSLDLRPFAAGISYPGIDPRRWVVLAEVVEVGIDADEGVALVDVLVVPTGEEMTAQLSMVYAGEGFGFWAPPEPGTLVALLMPEGDPAAGPVVLGALWTAREPLPVADLATEQEDVPTSNVVLRVKSGNKLRLLTSGGGNIEIVAEGTGEVLLGSATATRGAARLDDEVDLGYFITERNGDKDIMWWRFAPTDAWQQIDDTPVPPLISDLGTRLTGKIKSASTKVKVEG